MKISNYMNNTNSIMEKNTDKVQKGNSQTNEKHTVGQSVKLSISKSFRFLMRDWSIIVIVYSRVDRKNMMMWFKERNC